jgi:hypothetical protein
MRRVSARDALDYALDTGNLLLYGLVVVGWLFVFSFEVADYFGGLESLLPDVLFGLLFGAVDLVVDVVGTVALLAGLVALVYRAAAEAG